MQSYPLVLDSVANTRQFSVDADFFVYESGSAPSGDNRIVVKPESGAEITLRPGQRVRLARGENARAWYVRSLDGTSSITGNIVIGSGAFEDSSSVVTLSASSVLNAAALPVQKQALSTLTNFVPVVVGIAAVALVSDPTQRSLRIRNTHASATVYIGGAGVTVANAGIAIGPGATWTEDDAPGAAWYAISDTAATNVAILGLKL